MADKVKETTSTTTTTITPAQAATMEEYKASPYYQNLNIQQLQEQAAGYATDDATLRGQAESLYKPTYDAELESIKQGLATQNQAYDAQKASLQQNYDKQRRLTNESYDESAVDLNNILTKRGLGRSSLVSTQNTYLENKRQQALSDIGSSESAAYADIDAKKSLAAQQAAQSKKRLSTDYATQIEARISELRQQNQSALTSLQLQIATLQQQGYQAYQAWLAQQKQVEITQQNADREYELALRQQQLAEDQFAYQKSKSSGSSGGSSNYPVYSQQPTPKDAGSGSDDWVKKLMGSQTHVPVGMYAAQTVNAAAQSVLTRLGIGQKSGAASASSGTGTAKPSISARQVAKPTSVTYGRTPDAKY